MKIAIGIISLLILSNLPNKIDFGSKKAGQNWYAVNDGVMGGLSDGSLKLTENSLKFEGTISLENNGGFSSIRSEYGQYDLSKYTKVTMRIKTDNSSFALLLERHKRWFRPYFKQEFKVTAGEWQTVTFDFSEFDEYTVGRKKATTMTKSDLSSVIRMGFITNDKTAKAFSLEIDYIEFL